MTALVAAVAVPAAGAVVVRVLVSSTALPATPAPTVPAAQRSSEPLPTPPVAAAIGPRISVDLGCADGLDAAGLSAWLARPSPVIGFDNAHVYPLGGSRYLWLVNDAYVDHAGTVTALTQAAYVNNLAIVQVGSCFSALHGGSLESPSEFELGILPDLDSKLFFWPLGGTLVDGQVHVVWAQMLNDHPSPASIDGIVRHPIATWYATYDAETLERLNFRPMPNSGVFPQYGFDVETVGDWTYLFGNSNLLNFSYEGGFFGADHSATRMYVARVPRGRLDELPTYWDGAGWSPDPTASVPISERFALENQMQVAYIEGQWIAVTKEDGFVGRDLVVDVATEPWGPWIEVARSPMDAPRPEFGGTEDPSVIGGADRVAYHPFILPWSEGDVLTIMASATAIPWEEAIDNLEFYRSFVVDIPRPSLSQN